MVLLLLIINTHKIVLQFVKDLLPYWQYKNYLVKYFTQYVRNGLIIHLVDSLKNNVC